ncbi:MAG: hypothetical protein V4736_08765 [Bdellovibrionota bacterium]
MAYFKHIREDRMPEVRAEMGRRGIQDGRFINLAALSMYGPNPAEGKKRALAAVKIAGNNYQKFYAEMRKDPYITATFNKYNLLVATTQKNSPELASCFNFVN